MHETVAKLDLMGICRVIHENYISSAAAFLSDMIEPLIEFGIFRKYGENRQISRSISAWERKKYQHDLRESQGQ